LYRRTHSKALRGKRHACGHSYCRIKHQHFPFFSVRTVSLPNLIVISLFPAWLSPPSSLSGAIPSFCWKLCRAVPRRRPRHLHIPRSLATFRRVWVARTRLSASAKHARGGRAYRPFGNADCRPQNVPTWICAAADGPRNYLRRHRASLRVLCRRQVRALTTWMAKIPGPSWYSLLGDVIDSPAFNLDSRRSGTGCGSVDSNSAMPTRAGQNGNEEKFYSICQCDPM
jgi:hypothetical protein